jgi:A/G-specific adenine glycosylase
MREVDVAVVVAVARDDSGEIQFLLRKRPNTGLLAGMWEFPGVAVAEAPALEAARRLATDLGLKVGKDSVELEMITHLFSHLKVRYWPFLFVVEGWRGQPVELAGNRWVLKRDLDEVPLPVAQGRILQEAMERSQP